MMIFLLLPILGIIYVSWHVYTLVPLPQAWRWGIIGFGVVSFLMIFLNLTRTIDHLPMPLARFVYDLGNSSIFILLYLAITFFVLDIARWTHLMPPSWLHQNFYTTACITLGMFVVFLVSNINYRDKVREELTLTTNKPLEHPVKMVLMSDLHLGYHNPKAELHRWVDIINREQPDLILIAGDIIDMSIRPLVEENMAEEFRRLDAPVYACLGNHEYYTGEPQAQQFYRDAGIHLLRDTFAIAGDVIIIGRDDRTNPHRKSLDKIMASIPSDYRTPSSHEAEGQSTANSPKYTILLDHQPYNLEEAEQAGIDFQFSGHTHYGQVWPVSWITDALYECAYGRHERGNTSYYVSSGLGIWGGKFRIGTQSEYVVAEIKTKK